MLEFDMPPESEEKRLKRFEKALKAAGIEVAEEKFSLDISEGKILAKVHDAIGVVNLRRELSLGCAANVPSMKCCHSNNGNRLSYVRMLNAGAAKEGLYKEGIPVIDKITEAMSNPGKYSESLFVHKRGKNAVMQSEDNSWCLRINGYEIIDMGQCPYPEGAVDFMLEFYAANNL